MINVDNMCNCFSQNMKVNESDFTFTSQTGSDPVQCGYADDCNGGHSLNPCPHFGTAIIDTRGTELVVDPTVCSNFGYSL